MDSLDSTSRHARRSTFSAPSRCGVTRARTCSCCGHLNRGAIPPEIRAHVLGPRLAAVMSYFSGRHHIGRRGVEEVVETVFEVPTSLGSVFALEGETSAALAGPYQEAQAAIRDDTWVLAHLFVAPEHQSAGVGAALLQRAHAYGPDTTIGSVDA